MRDAYVLGTFSTKFAKLPDTSFKELTREAYLGVLADAGLETGADIEQAWFGNCGMGTFGQRNVRGHVCLTPLIREGLFPERVSIMNVEGGCATASMAFHGAWKDILSGQVELSLAIGVEKTFFPDSAERTLEIFEGGIDQFDPEEWHDYYAAAGEAADKPFDPHGGGGTVFMDTYAMQAAYHMKRHGTSQRQIAIASSKNHHHGSMNPKAHYRFEVSVEQALQDRLISWPLTRSMCAPIGDGAAAALLCSEDYLRAQPEPSGTGRSRCAPRHCRAASIARSTSRACRGSRAIRPTRPPTLAPMTSRSPKCTTRQASARSFNRKCSASAHKARAATTSKVVPRHFPATGRSTSPAGSSPRAIRSARRACRCSTN